VSRTKRQDHAYGHPLARAEDALDPTFRAQRTEGPLTFQTILAIDR